MNELLNLEDDHNFCFWWHISKSDLFLFVQNKPYAILFKNFEYYAIETKTILPKSYIVDHFDCEYVYFALMQTIWLHNH